mgnify:CR=1 FL=1
MTDTLYDRLGGSDGIRNIVNDLVENHLTNSRIAPRFANSDAAAMKTLASDFFIMGAGGPNNYKGSDMVTAHKAMNIDNDEFMAVLDDAMAALEKNDVGQREREEVLFILYSMRQDVVGQ